MLKDFNNNDNNNNNNNNNDNNNNNNNNSNNNNNNNLARKFSLPLKYNAHYYILKISMLDSLKSGSISWEK